MRKNRWCPKGFTLIELVIVIVIIGILSTIGVPVYRSYVRDALLTEGRGLCGSIIRAEKEYYGETDKYLGVERTMFCPALGVDASDNKYFRAFEITLNGNACDIIAFGTSPESNTFTVHYQLEPGKPPALISEGG